jgi:hypothetical protein
MATRATSTRPERLVAESIVIDMTAPGSPLGILTPDEPSTDEWYHAYESAGCTFISCTIGADHVASSIEACVGEIAKPRHWLLGRPDRFMLVEKADDILEAKKNGKLGVCLNFQGTLQYQRNLKLVETTARRHRGRSPARSRAALRRAVALNLGRCAQCGYSLHAIPGGDTASGAVLHAPERSARLRGRSPVRPTLLAT